MMFLYDHKSGYDVLIWPQIWLWCYYNYRHKIVVEV